MLNICILTFPRSISQFEEVLILRLVNVCVPQFFFKFPPLFFISQRLYCAHSVRIVFDAPDRLCAGTKKNSRCGACLRSSARDKNVKTAVLAFKGPNAIRFISQDALVQRGNTYTVLDL